MYYTIHTDANEWNEHSTWKAPSHELNCFDEALFMFHILFALILFCSLLNTRKIIKLNKDKNEENIVIWTYFEYLLIYTQTYIFIISIYDALYRNQKQQKIHMEEQHEAREIVWFSSDVMATKEKHKLERNNKKENFSTDIQ